MLSDVRWRVAARAASEPTVAALGHTFRKLRMFKEAAACFDSALSILPGQASTFAGLAYTYHLQVGFPCSGPAMIANDCT